MTLDDLKAIRRSLPEQVLKTPVLPGPYGWLHAESLQTTGSYKLRAAFHVLQSLTPEERKRGAALTSSGNFAQAFAYAGKVLGIPTVVVMQEGASGFKMERTKSYGAELVLCEHRFEARFEALRKLQEERGITAIDHMEDERVVHGHATVALDLLEQLKPPQILVPVSTAGLLAGVAMAVKLSDPSIRVIGVQPEKANATALSFAQGEVTPIAKADSQCDALSASRPGHLPFRLVQQFVDDVVTVSEEAISDAVRYLATEAKLVVEPGGAVGVAALRSGVVQAPAAALLSGGNLDPRRLAGYLS